MCSPPMAAVSSATLRAGSQAVLPLVQAAVERGEDRSGGDLQVALLELLGEPGGVVGQVAVGAQFDPLVAGFGHLVEEALPRGLLGVIREPDAPGVRRGADDQLVLSHCHSFSSIAPQVPFWTLKTAVTEQSIGG